MSESANRPKSGKRKAPKTAFKPGQSGNPGGRPKINEEFRERARKAVDAHVLDAWIGEVVARGDEWMRAAENLASYGYGKPAQAVQVSADENAGLEIVIRTVATPVED